MPDGRGLCKVIEAIESGIQKIVGKRKRRRLAVGSSHVPAEESLLLIDLVVDPANDLVFVDLVNRAKGDAAAGIRRFWQQLHNGERLRAESRGVNLLVGKRAAVGIANRRGKPR